MMTRKEPDSEEKKPTPARSNKVELSVEEHEALLKRSEELAQLKEKYLRSAADFDNAKKRLTKEREAFFKFALENVIYELLPVLDNLDFALSHATSDDEKTKSLKEGWLLIQKQLMSVLTEKGLKRLETIGKPFDPHLHEAVEHVRAEAHEDGTIVAETVAGYELNGKLLRPAKVKVANKEKKETLPETTEPERKPDSAADTSETGEFP